MASCVAGIAVTGRLLVRQIALERGVVGAENAAHVACDELGLPGRTGHTFIVNFSQSKTSRTHAGSGGRGGCRHAGGAGGARGIPGHAFVRANSTGLAHGVCIPEVPRVACTVQDRR